MLKIAITSLSAYSEGVLHFEWIELGIEKEELQSCIDRVLKKGEALCHSKHHEEYFISDAEWDDISLWEVGEYDSIFDLNDRIILIEENIDEHQFKAVKFLFDNSFAENIEEIIEKSLLDDVIIYEDSSMEDIAEEYVENFINLDNLNPLIASNICYASIGRDLELDGSYYIEGRDVFEYIG